MTREEALAHAEVCANAAMQLAHKAGSEQYITTDQQQGLATTAQAYATAGAVFTAIAALREPEPRPAPPGGITPDTVVSR